MLKIEEIDEDIIRLYYSYLKNINYLKKSLDYKKIDKKQMQVI